MAKKDNWRTATDYTPSNVNWEKIKNDPAKYGYTQKSVEKVTVPGQSQTVKEILKRYEKGRPEPNE